MITLAESTKKDMITIYLRKVLNGLVGLAKVTRRIGNREKDEECDDG